jgi:hypothetical protein
VSGSRDTVLVKPGPSVAYSSKWESSSSHVCVGSRHQCDRRCRSTCYAAAVAGASLRKVQVLCCRTQPTACTTKVAVSKPLQTETCTLDAAAKALLLAAASRSICDVHVRALWRRGGVGHIVMPLTMRWHFSAVVTESTSAGSSPLM